MLMCLGKNSEKNWNSLYFQAKHGHVVALLRLTDEIGHLVADVVDGVLGTLPAMLPQHVNQSAVRELIVGGVFGFVHAIGIDEEGVSLDVLNGLAHILRSFHYADGHIGLHLQELRVGAKENGWDAQHCRSRDGLW